MPVTLARLIAPHLWTQDDVDQINRVVSFAFDQAAFATADLSDRERAYITRATEGVVCRRSLPGCVWHGPGVIPREWLGLIEARQGFPE